MDYFWLLKCVTATMRKKRSRQRPIIHSPFLCPNSEKFASSLKFFRCSRRVQYVRSKWSWSVRVRPSIRPSAQLRRLFPTTYGRSAWRSLDWERRAKLRTNVQFASSVQNSSAAELLPLHAFWRTQANNLTCCGCCCCCDQSRHTRTPRMRISWDSSSLLSAELNHCTLHVVVVVFDFCEPQVDWSW